MKILKITTRMLLISVFLFFSACTKDDSTITSDTTDSEYDSPLYQVADLDEMENPGVTTPSETTEISFENSESTANETHPPCMGKMDNRHEKEKSCHDKNGKVKKGTNDKVSKNGKPVKKDNKNIKKQDPRGLPFILKQLNLTERQKEAIKGFLANHCDCVSEHHQKVHGIHNNLIKRANERRNELLASYKAGKITKEQLHRMMGELKNNVKSEMQKHDEKRNHIRIMRKCRQDLINNIESVLNNEQLQKWNRWKTSHK